jgi:hypothetical protein
MMYLYTRTRITIVTTRRISLAAKRFFPLKW